MAAAQSTSQAQPAQQSAQTDARARIHRWGWLGVLWAGNCGAWAMPGMGGPAWLIWLAPLGLLVIAWLGVRAPQADSDQKGQAKAQSAAKNAPESKALRLKGCLRRLFFLGWLAGMLHFLISLSWLNEIAQTPRIVSVFGWFALCCYLALYHGLFTLFVGWLLPRSQKLLVSFSTPKTQASASDSEQAAAGKRKASSRLASLQQTRPPEQWWLPPLFNVGFSLTVALLWCGLETLRDWVFGGFSWNGYSAPLIDQSVIAQLADLSGAIALSALPVFVACLLWGLAARVRVRLKYNLGPRPQLDLLVLVLFAALMIQHALPWLTKSTAAGFAGDGQEGEFQVKALALQPLISQTDKWDIDPETQRFRPETILKTHENYLELVEQGQRKAQQLDYQRMEKDLRSSSFASGLPGHLDLIVLPESAYPQTVGKSQGKLSFTFTGTTEQGEQFEFVQPPLQLLSELQLDKTPILSGFNLSDSPLEEELPARYYNALIQLGADAELSSYQKRHLVPFGEYLPLRPLLPFLHDLIPGNFDSGADDQELVLPLRASPAGEEVLRIAPLICFEDTVARLARKSIVQNPQRTLLLNATNDGWFGETAAEQHLANARFRAIELRRPLLRSGNSGGTAAVDVNGSLRDPWDKQRRQVVEADLNELDHRGVLFARLKVPSSQNPPETLYLKWGNWIGWAGVWLLLGLVLHKLGRGRVGKAGKVRARVGKAGKVSKN